MTLRKRTRAYSLAMAALNLGVAGFLFYLSRLTVSATGALPVVIVALLAVVSSLLTVFFAVVTIGWLVDSLRPGELGEVLPKVRPRPRPESDRDAEARSGPEPMTGPIAGRSRRRA